MHKTSNLDIDNVALWMRSILTELKKAHRGSFSSAPDVEKQMAKINATLASIEFSDGQRFAAKEGVK